MNSKTLRKLLKLPKTKL